MNWEAVSKPKTVKSGTLLLTLSRLSDRAGTSSWHAAIRKDITTEKDLQAKLIQSEQEAAIGRAVTAIQHAIKNMLNTLKGGVYIVRLGSKKQPERTDYRRL